MKQGSDSLAGPNLESREREREGTRKRKRDGETERERERKRERAWGKKVRERPNPGGHAPDCANIIVFVIGEPDWRR